MTRVPDGHHRHRRQTYADGNPLGTPGEHKHHTKAPAKLTLSTVAAALPVAIRKLAPRQMIHSPVMFTVLVGAACAR